MKIGIDARFYGSLGKGLGRYTEKLLTYLECIPDDTHSYVIFLRQENFDEYQPTHHRFKKVIADYPWYGWQEQFFFPLLLSRHHLDLVHFPHFNVPLLVHEPFIVTIHDLILLHFPTVKASELPPFLYWLKYLAYRTVIALAIRRSRAIVAVSSFTERDIESSYPAARGKIFVTLEAADPYCSWLHPESEQRLFERLGLQRSESFSDSLETKPFVLYVGNAYPHKNLRVLLEVAPAFSDTLFLCVGKDDYFYRSFQEQVAAAGVANIHFAGYLDDASLGALYRRASIYFFPSLYEGFGLPGLEAMNYGTPVVAARAGSLPEIYGRAAIYFDPNDTADCIVALRKAFRKEGREMCRIQGFAQAKQFSWDRMARDTLRLYVTAQKKR
ncbi:MAG: glycosyltransferase family 1 protein [Candidatus Moraniibacteriota bacterium]